MNISEIWTQFGDKYITALETTLELTLISFICALMLGIIITVLRVAPIKPLRAFGNFYVQIFRNIPGACLLIILVYAFPYINLLWSYKTCVLIATTLIPAAFASEYLISGMNTIGKGQIEAARSLGMSFTLIIKDIVLPQALRSSVLQLTNLLVATMLTTSLASQVPMSPRELTGIVSYISTHAAGGVSAFIISAIFYVLIAFVIGQIGNLIDRKVRILR